MLTSHTDVRLTVVSWRRGLWRKWHLLLTSLTDRRQVDSVVVATRSVKEVTSLVDVSCWPSSGWQWCRWRLLLTSGWHINWYRGNEVSEGSDVSCWRLLLTSGWHHKGGIVATGSVLSTMTSCLSDWRQFYAKSKVSSRQLWDFINVRLAHSVVLSLYLMSVLHEVYIVPSRWLGRGGGGVGLCQIDMVSSCLSDCGVSLTRNSTQSTTTTWQHVFLADVSLTRSIALTPRLWHGIMSSWLTSVWHGLLHSVHDYDMASCPPDWRQFDTVYCTHSTTMTWHYVFLADVSLTRSVAPSQRLWFDVLSFWLTSCWHEIVFG